MCYDRCKTRFSAAGRAPEEEGKETIVLDGLSKKRAGRQNVVLSHQLFHHTGAHPRGKRCRLEQFLLAAGFE